MSRSAVLERDRAATIIQLGAQFGLGQLALEAVRRGTTITEFQAQAAQRAVADRSGFSFAGALRAMFEDPRTPKLGGIEGDLLREYAGGEGFDPLTWQIPWSALVTRDLNVGAGSAGGFLVGDQRITARDLLRPHSVVVSGGIEIVDNVSEGAAVPVGSTTTSIAWLASETDSASPSTPAMLQIAAAPKIAVGLLQFSRRLLQQASIESFVRRELIKTAATAVDAAALGGSGTSGEPLGIVNVAGANAVDGSSFSHAKAVAMKGACANANAPDSEITFAAPPAVRELLELRELTSGSGQFVWKNDRVADRTATVSTSMPAATLTAGAWSTATLLLYGRRGVQLDFNRFDSALFRAGILQCRVLVACDVLFPQPAAFSVASSIS